MPAFRLASVPALVSQNGPAPTDVASGIFHFRESVFGLRLINAGADTAYRFAVGGHRLSVTHTDGFPVEPVTVDTLIIGMGERYDVVVTTGDGVFPVVAVPEGRRTRYELADARLGHALDDLLGVVLAVDPSCAPGLASAADRTAPAAAAVAVPDAALEDAP